MIAFRISAAGSARLALRLACSLPLAGVARTATAQQQSVATAARSLDGRLDPTTRRAVLEILDSVARSALPTTPLVDKALEGAAKGASGPRIVGAVRALAVDLHVARSTLGIDADDAALAAAVGALRVGVSPPQLHQLRAARHEAAIAWPLTVLSDLVTRGVPADTAVSVILGMARAGATDAAFSRFAADVVRDIEAGVPPGSAAVARAGADARPAARPAAGRAPVPRGSPAPATPVRPAPPRGRGER